MEAIQDRMAAELKSRVTSLVQRVELGERKFKQIMREISEMTADIRSLQAGNRRILEREFGPDFDK